MYELMFDGLFRNTPKTRRAGLMGIGWVIFEREYLVAQGYGVLGRGFDATSNIAEYLALNDGLQALLDLGVRNEPVLVLGDARVVINQMKGLCKVNAARIVPLHQEALRLADRLEDINWMWVPRKKNKLADRLTRRALRELLADPQGFRTASSVVQKDYAARRRRLHDFGGMMVVQPVVH